MTRLVLACFLLCVAVPANAQIDGPPSDSAQVFPGFDAPAVADPLGPAAARGDRRYAQFDNEGALEAYSDLPLGDDFGVLVRLARTWNERGMDLAAEGRGDEAESAYSRAVEAAERLREFHPDRRETWFYLAVCYGNLALFKGGRDKVHIGRDVETFARRALEIDPRYALAHVTLGIFYREVAALNWVQRTLAKALFGGVPPGSNTASEEYLRNAVELDPGSVIAHYELALTLEVLDRDGESAALLARVSDLSPVNTEERRKIADARARLRAMSR